MIFLVADSIVAADNILIRAIESKQDNRVHESNTSSPPSIDPSVACRYSSCPRLNRARKREKEGRGESRLKIYKSEPLLSPLPIWLLHAVAAVLVVALIQLQRRARKQLIVEHELLAHHLRLCHIQRRVRRLHTGLEH